MDKAREAHLDGVYRAGRAAKAARQSKATNPYDLHGSKLDSDLHHSWLEGWCEDGLAEPKASSFVFTI